MKIEKGLHVPSMNVSQISDLCSSLAELLKPAVQAIDSAGSLIEADFGVPAFNYCEGLFMEFHFSTEWEDMRVEIVEMVPFLTKIKELGGSMTPMSFTKDKSSVKIEVHFPI